jgi:hypothetical protein
MAQYLGASADLADELRAFREIAHLRTVALPRPADRETDPDRETDLVSGARAARELGLGRLAERLEAAQDVGDLQLDTGASQD